MSAEWMLSPRLVTFLTRLIAESVFAGQSSQYYPSIMWSLGGTMQGPDKVVRPIPPQYDVGVVRRSNLRNFKIILPDKTFGYVVFAPKPEDAASQRRLIDWDGETIVVR